MPKVQLKPHYEYPKQRPNQVKRFEPKHEPVHELQIKSSIFRALKKLILSAALLSKQAPQDEWQKLGQKYQPKVINRPKLIRVHRRILELEKKMMEKQFHPWHQSELRRLQKLLRQLKAEKKQTPGSNWKPKPKPRFKPRLQLQSPSLHEKHTQKRTSKHIIERTIQEIQAKQHRFKMQYLNLIEESFQNDLSPQLK